MPADTPDNSGNDIDFIWDDSVTAEIMRQQLFRKTRIHSVSIKLKTDTDKENFIRIMRDLKDELLTFLQNTPTLTDFSIIFGASRHPENVTALIYPSINNCMTLKYSGIKEYFPSYYKDLYLIHFRVVALNTLFNEDERNTIATEERTLAEVDALIIDKIVRILCEKRNSFLVYPELPRIRSFFEDPNYYFNQLPREIIAQVFERIIPLHPDRFMNACIEANRDNHEFSMTPQLADGILLYIERNSTLPLNSILLAYDRAPWCFEFLRQLVLKKNSKGTLHIFFVHSYERNFRLELDWFKPSSPEMVIFAKETYRNLPASDPHYEWLRILREQGVKQFRARNVYYLLQDVNYAHNSPSLPTSLKAAVLAPFSKSNVPREKQLGSKKLKQVQQQQQQQQTTLSRTTMLQPSFRT